MNVVIGRYFLIDCKLLRVDRAIVAKYSVRLFIGSYSRLIPKDNDLRQPRSQDLIANKNWLPSIFEGQ